MTGKMVLIDGHSLAHRAFHALKEQGLKTSKGLPTSAVYGVVMMTMRLLEEEKPEYLMVAFDVGKTFRHESFESYKATRQPADEEFKIQIPYIKRFFELLGAVTAGVEGYEADDVIGTMTREARNKGVEVYILSGDKDLFQLLEEGVTIIYPRRGITERDLITAETMQEKYDLTPGQWVDFKALKGDPSDNIPGIPRIGDKTATRLLKQFGTLERLLQHLDEVGRPKERELLAAHVNEVKEYRRLASILRNIPLPVSLEDCRWKQPGAEVFTEFFRELEFKSLLKRMDLKDDRPEVETGEFRMPEYTLLKEEELAAWLEGAGREEITLQFLAEKAGWLEGKALGLALSLSGGRQGYLPLSPGSRVFPDSLAKWLDDPQARKNCYDAKTQMRLVEHYGISLRGVAFDTQIAAYLLKGGIGATELPLLAKELLGYKEIPTIEDRRGKELDFFSLPPDLPVDKAAPAAVSRALLGRELRPLLFARLEQDGMEKLFKEVELPLISVLFRMERRGIKVSPERLAALRERFSARIRKLEAEIYELAGEEFNISSPKQLGSILFERLKLPAIKKTKTGYSTDAEVLEELSDRHPLVRKVLEYRGVVKLNTTYVDALLSQAHPETGRVHTTFQQAVTATGRLSSTDPNLQNIPVRSEEGMEIRRCFIPGDGDKVFISADYSQIELRVLAHLSGDGKLLSAFRQEEDIHRRTAAEIFNIPIEGVTPALRDQAKAVNFGIIYGISGFGLAKGTGVSRKEADEYIKAYFHRYSGVKAYLEELIERAREEGYVTTILNRRRYLPDLTSRNFQKRSFAERMARNTPVQGSAADLIKLAMVRVEERLEKEKAPAQVLLQVHDELLVEADRKASWEVAQVLREEMENAYPLSVPVRVDIKTGDSWGDLHA